jgi:hypothetical protein
MRCADRDCRGLSAVNITVTPIRVNTGSGDIEGQLVTLDDRLVAVLVRLDDPGHDSQTGAWFLEAGFGRFSAPEGPVFPDLDAAKAWILERA